jgi:hypothetical protein
MQVDFCLFVPSFVFLPFGLLQNLLGGGALCSAFLLSVNNDNLSFFESMSHGIPK